MAQENRPRMTVVPDTYVDEDQIGYGDHVAGLVEMARAVDAKGSFTIGVFGEWGQGKTSALWQIRKGLPKEDANGKRILTVWFNPWQFVGEQHLIIPFFHTLVAALKRYRKAAETGGWPPELRDSLSIFLKELAHVPVALAYGVEAEGKVPGLLAAKFGFAKTIEESRRHRRSLREALKGKRSRSYEQAVEKYESMYYTLLESLRDVTKNLKLKIVVFVDDLDRCLPEKAVDLLEGLKVLLDLPGFVFVIGVAPQIIERGVEHRYRGLFLWDADEKEDQQGESKRGNRESLAQFGREYLEKIIQFHMTVPKPREGRLKEHIVGLMRGLERAHPYYDMMASVLGDNPRKLKRFINRVSYNLWVADRVAEEQHLGAFEPLHIIRLALIESELPGLYMELRTHPRYLVVLQEALDEFVEGEWRDITDQTEFDKIKRTDHRIVDRWLVHPRVMILYNILRLRKRGRDENDEAQGEA